jgi:hypothetical protein
VNEEQSFKYWLEEQQNKSSIYEKLLIHIHGNNALKIERYFEDKSNMYHAHILQKNVNYTAFFHSLFKELGRLFGESCVNRTKLFNHGELAIYRQRQVDPKVCQNLKNIINRKVGMLEQIVYRVKSKIKNEKNEEKRVGPQLSIILKDSKRFMKLALLLGHDKLDILKAESIKFSRSSN